jgi:hypothetical protein
MDQRMLDTLAIKEVVENWAVFRDSGDWERFRTVWHEEGVMMATWFQGPFEEFIRVNQEGWNKGVSILHLLGGTSVEVAGTRAIAQTKMTISQRAPVHDVVVSTTSSKNAKIAGPSFCGGYSMRRIGWIPSTLPKLCNSIRKSWRNSPKATATWPTCNPASDSRSKWICLG